MSATSNSDIIHVLFINKQGYSSTEQCGKCLSELFVAVRLAMTLVFMNHVVLMR